MERTLESTILHVARMRLVHDYPTQIATCLAHLTEDQLWWRPNDRANAVGNLVLHLAGSNRYYLAHVIAGEENHRDREAEFRVRGGSSKADVHAVWDDSVMLTKRVLDGLDESRMMEATDRSGKMTTFAQILLHVTHHTAVHTGQIVYVTKLLAPGTIDDIWMKARSR
jgi:uncharacterized damage-inducible protein DinB